MAAVASVAGPPSQRVVLTNISWETYESLLADHVDRHVPRFAYDQGVLEIVSPSPMHEGEEFALAQVVVIVAEELEIELGAMGSTTYRRKGLGKGFEADASFYFREDRFVQKLTEVDPAVDPPPDLVIEVDVSHQSLDKLPIYAAMGVPEVWRRANDRFTILVLEADRYREVPGSVAILSLTGVILTRFVDAYRTEPCLAWIRSVRAWACSLPADGALS